jgi:uncharacterized membrane protein
MLLIICPLIFCAGFIDAIAGGGGLIALPAYLFAGLPSHDAIGTNKLAGGSGLIASSIKYLKEGKVRLSVAVWSALGCIGGAAAALGLYCTASDSKALLKELMAWYKESSLPMFERDEPVVAQVVPGSVNCADSLGKFFQATGITTLSDPGRIVRCSCLAADVAKKTVELLNAHYGV